MASLRVEACAAPKPPAGTVVRLFREGEGSGPVALLGRDYRAAARCGGGPGVACVSRQHAEVHRVGAVCFIVDCGSMAGTWVDGALLAPHQPRELRPGARVTLAGPDAARAAITFTFLDGEDEKKGALEQAVRTEAQCAVCQELLVAAHALECSHAFCGECVARWARLHRTCPLCRAPARAPPVPVRALDALVDAVAKSTLSAPERAARARRQRSWLAARKSLRKPPTKLLAASL